MAAEKIARRIGIPLDAWPGACHTIAAALLVKKITHGRLRYGMWLGPVASQVLGKPSPFLGRRWTHHGWVERAHGSGVPLIIDPTRWVFEGVEPYVYAAHDVEGWYDTAGDKLRGLFRQPFPETGHGPPGDKVEEKQMAPELAELLRCVVAEQAEVPLDSLPVQTDGRLKLTARQWCWIANLPAGCFGPAAHDFYTMLEAHDDKALIPIDSWETVMGDGCYGRDPARIVADYGRAARQKRGRK